VWQKGDQVVNCGIGLRRKLKKLKPSKSKGRRVLRILFRSVAWELLCTTESEKGQ